MKNVDILRPWLSISPFYSKKRVSELKSLEEELMLHDDWIKERLSEKRGQGIKTFEYGELVSALRTMPQVNNAVLLDVGPGNSTFPAFLSTLVRKVVTLDLPSRLEKLSHRSHHILNQERVENTTGDMLDMPFPEAYFDWVTSLSAIEHLDDPGPGKDGKRVQIPREIFLEKTRKALSQMIRVLKPGGYLYVTTDAYLPDRQKDCSWSHKRGDGLIWSAYHFRDIRDVFLEVLKKENCEFDPRLESSPDFLLESEDFAMYRGRFFTTFCLLARKKVASS